MMESRLEGSIALFRGRWISEFEGCERDAEAIARPHNVARLRKIIVFLMRDKNDSALPLTDLERPRLCGEPLGQCRYQTLDETLSPSPANRPRRWAISWLIKVALVRFWAVHLSPVDPLHNRGTEMKRNIWR